MTADPSNSSRGRTRSRRAKALGELVGGALEETVRKRGFVSAEVVTRWREIAGPRIADGSVPGELKWPRRGGSASTGATLVIFADGPVALIITHDTPRLLERVNRLFGYQAVTSIRVVQRALSQPEPVRRQLPIITLEDELAVSKALKGFADGELRTALERLGRNVTASNKRS